MLRKLGKDTPVNQSVDEVISSLAPEGVDSALIEGDEDKGPVFLMDDVDDNPTMTSIDPKFAEGHGMTAASKIRAKNSEEFKDARDISPAKPASEVDLENLDESMIMNMPEIKAASFEVLTMLNLKPRDKSIRFRWANFKNDVAGNLSRYFAMGFQTASIKDVDTERTPVHESMIDGTQVKYYDILLIKIPVMRLMSLYKANIIKSVNRLANARQRGLKEANRQFSGDIQNEGQAGRYEAARAKLGGREPVEFYTPGVEESQVVST